MRLDGRRSSNNVEDRRGALGRGGKIAGVGGIGALVIAALVAWLSGGNPLDVLTQQTQTATSQEISGDYKPTEKEEQYAEFAKKILAGTEDVWTDESGSSSVAPTRRSISTSRFSSRWRSRWGLAETSPTPMS